MIALAAYTPHRWTDALGYLTAWWTDRDPNSRTPPGRPWVSHVEVVIDGMCHSSSLRDGGVRAKRIDLDRPHWRVIPTEWADEDAALRVYHRHEGMPYGWMDLLTQHVLRLPFDDPGLLCSELCALMLGLPESTARGMSPGQLVEYVISRNAK